MYESSLCWECEKACGGCVWADELKPVKGWTAERTYDEDGRPYSYLVRACPEFSRERQPFDPDMENAIQMIAKAVEVAMKDFISGNASIRKEVLYFLADWIPDQYDEVRKMKQEAAEHDRKQLEAVRKRREGWDL